MKYPDNPTTCHDNTRISAYKECPRKYFIRHTLDWVAEGTALPLSFGLAWHAGQDIVWEQAKRLPPPVLRDAAMGAFLTTWEEEGLAKNPSLEQQEWMSPRTPGIANEMYYNYIQERWKMLQECDVLAIEMPVAVPLPESEGKWYIGKLDKVIQYAGITRVIEHKSTTAYAVKGNFQPSYVDSWFASSQVKGYQFMGGLYYENLADVWVDAALVHKKVHDAFKFIPISHSVPLLQEWLIDTNEWVARIDRDSRTFQKEGRLVPGIFPRNEDSCYGKFGTQCPFLDICRTTRDPSQLTEPPPGYVQDKWEPFSILGLDKIIQTTEEK